MCVALITACLLFAGCEGMSELGIGRSRVSIPEYRQKVGLYVEDRIDRFYYFGSASTDASELMVFHLQQVLPFMAQNALKQIFEEVELCESGPKITFRNKDLAGYFRIKIVSVRYDYPTANLNNYRAEVELLVEFKTLQHNLIWSQYFRGDGFGISDANARLTDFGRGTSYALEDAFEKAVDEMEDEVYKSTTIRAYFRQNLPPGS